MGSSDIWVSLFSGGKDSSWALYRAMNDGLDVGRLVTVDPPSGSYLYHQPNMEFITAVAESIHLPLDTVDVWNITADDVSDSAEQGDIELEPLESWLGEVPSLAGVVNGAMASEYQRSRLSAMCSRLDCSIYNPLWRREPLELASDMINAGFDIRISQVAADGLNQTWLGRRLDRTALEELRDLNRTHGVHVLGEGGEFETIVLDGPHMSHPINIEYDISWDGVRGHIDITTIDPSPH